MDAEQTRDQIRKDAAEIARLHARIHETVRHRQESAEKRLEWEQACADFHARYSNLAFPGGYAGALERITAGDPITMEAAICFLECRPYFFRSGYMFKDILRKCRRAPLTAGQSNRLKIIEDKLEQWRQRKQSRNRRRNQW
jgi:hypothetical protein